MSQRDVPDWMPLYVYEFQADRHVQAMDLSELGAYFLLIMSQWVNGSVPSDLKVLAKMLRNQSPEDMERIWTAVGPCFKPHARVDGEMIQGRVEEERKIALRKLAGNSRGGKEAARRRMAEASGREDAPDPLSAKTARLAAWAAEDADGGASWAEAAFEELWEAYPAKARVKRPLSQQLFCDKVRNAEMAGRVIAAVRGKWATSEKWSKGFVLALPEWINQECWDEEPEQVGGALKVAAEDTMDAETARRIREARKR